MDDLTAPTARLDGVTVPLPDDDRRLIDWFRDDLQLTTVKEGCGVGQCGACTILVDGRLTLSCSQLAVQVAGRDVTLIGGVLRTDVGRALATAFVEHGALQCGFCAPGMLITAYALVVGTTAAPDALQVRAQLAGNVCRCTGYQPIVEAIVSVMTRRAATIDPASVQ